MNASCVELSCRVAALGSATPQLPYAAASSGDGAFRDDTTAASHCCQLWGRLAFWCVMPPNSLARSGGSPWVYARVSLRQDASRR